MGGAVALMAAPDAPEIKAIVSESSYARLDLMAERLFAVPLLGRPLGFLTTLGARVLLGVNVRKTSPEASVARLTRPVLLIHSRQDHVIPFLHALRLQDALSQNPNAAFWFQDGLLHGEFGGDYQQRIEEFFAKHL